ncbi:phosphate regulon sensor histidine kinase PhoR [Pseudoalteromonas tunicata]|jgi:two-component system phosphate regulon sensor histidine kinase PhoR|uniref:Phosphate regulon sensor protein PhoR n=1 Tax=Pseudoalteromonas tunicata D2 TaxID=87626 RepID=A4C752_9GAMM|nr:phosphate regulon sensor histidine kinase PhoR [Pseudoalteromonas tunicata]ATC95777.1 two-component system, OmpR family, phosphate regulon sensor histidine kinase PhoR [Pseudoalteromonas tunicata]AXT31325.1 two-component system sensor histidine kinase PhoR [Pseudoalteromonas tunicata]EAR29806.1 phosphate regulon sensor protein phoR [Pseudoalteromonas tunicata D2]MDP4985278.1 phosphate regulon sensor histidine kinase PhoR [Pseudoalteromonas tunicata]MDP5214041.1 phosphate regulon sensor hist
MYRVINKRTLTKRLVIYFLPLLLIGVLIGAPFLLLFLGASVLMFWHYRQLYRLSDWLINQRSFNPPEGDGTWEQIFEGIYRLQHRNRNKRNELAELIRRFREGAEAVPDAVIVLQRDFSIVWCNQLALKVLGLKWPMDHGQRLDNLIRHPKFSLYMQAKKFEEPLELISPLGIEQVLEFRVMPYADAQLMMVVRDVTRLKQLEQMRKDFVANVSHELRTPLTVIAGYLEMMEPDDLPPARVWGKAHGTMLEQCKRMDSLVSQLLSLSRIEGLRRIDQDKTVDVPKMLKLVMIEAETLNRDKHHTLHCEIEEGLFILGGEDELRSAFSNLVFNAVHYTPAEGEITVKWHVNNGCAQFSVTDNGDGIAPEHIHRLTERFYRVDKARSRKTGGSGLGLAITKHVLSRHESELLIKSEVGKGSCFSFSFASNRVKQQVTDALLQLD